MLTRRMFIQAASAAVAYLRFGSLSPVQAAAPVVPDDAIVHVTTDGAADVVGSVSFVDVCTGPVATAGVKFEVLHVTQTSTVHFRETEPMAKTVLRRPPNGVERDVKAIHIRNQHPTNEVRVKVASPDYVWYIGELHAGERMEYVRGVGWYHVASA